jgi:hypothetical protein
MARLRTFRGTTEDLPLCEVLATIHSYKVPGQLLVRANRAEYEILFRDGAIAFVSSNREEDQFASLLLVMGKITSEEKAELLPGDGLSFRDQTAILVDKGLLSPEELIHFIRLHMIRILYKILGLVRADLQFRPGLPDGDDQIMLNINTTQVIYEAVRYIFEYDVLYPVIPRDEATLSLAPAREHVLAEITLLPGEQAILSLIDGRRSMAEIRLSSPLGKQGTDRFIAFLALLQVIGTNHRIS